MKRRARETQPARQKVIRLSGFDDLSNSELDANCLPAKNGCRKRTAAVIAAQGVQLEDFLAYMPQHTLHFHAVARAVASGTASMLAFRRSLTPTASRSKPAAWLDANAAVEQMTWAPGEPMLIKDRLVSDGGWIERPGCTIFNLYRPPTWCRKPVTSTPWLDLVHKVFPDEAEHIVLWLAHRVQRRTRRSTTRWCSAASPASARTPSWSRSSRRSAHGISPTSRRSRCSAASTAS